MTFSKRYEDFLVTALRLSLALIFVWFGFLKVAGFNPVFDLVVNSIFPFFASGAGLLILGLIEVAIGILLFSNKWRMLTHAIVFLHLLGTFSTILFGWHVIFDPKFPILTLSGEFVVKNLVLAISGLMILVHTSRKGRSQ